MSIATDIEGSATHGWTASSRTDMDRTYRSAARHSRRVRVLRIALPATVLVGSAALLLATWLNPLRAIPLSDRGPLVISGTKITMQLPRIAGYTRDARPYEFTAKTAAQDLTQPDRVELGDIRAKIETQDRAVIEMSALNGLYSRSREQLILRERIVFTSTAGFEGHLTEALVDMRGGNIVSDKPVEVKLLNGMLKANRLEVVESGQMMRFDGGVTLDLDSGAIDATQ